MDVCTVLRWQEHFESLMDRFGSCFPRGDLRVRGSEYLKGLLSDAQRKNSWQIAERAGDDKPYGMQRLLGRASWDADQLRDELIRYAKQHLLRDGGERGTLIVDESGFLKRGDKSAGVQCQYCGSVGTLANCQVGVFVALASSAGRMLIDRELYLPQGWCQDKKRCREAGIPKERRYARKAKLAINLLRRSFQAGIHPQWVLADEVYGNDGEFRRFLEQRHQPYVLAVASKHRLFLGEQMVKAGTLAEKIAVGRWQRIRVGQEGTRRAYEFAALPVGVAHPQRGGGLSRWLLIRRHLDTHECAYYLCLAPGGTTTEQLAKASAGRWQIESCFECAKGETGLDHYEVRSYVGWYRHISLSLLAAALLTVIRLAAAAEKKSRTRREAHG